jgi:hemolysin activation/secretion protein
MTVYGGYAEVHADLSFPGGNNTGRSYQASIRYDVPMISNQFLRYQSQFGFDFKRTNNAIFFEEIPFSIPSTPFTFSKNVNLTQFIYGWLLQYQTNHQNLDSFIQAYVSPGKWISDQTNSDYESIRPGAKNHWIYANTQITYEYKFSNELLLHLRGIGQISSQNLLPSEQLPLGGYNSVRGYDERQESKDSGALARVEIRSPLWPFFSKNKNNRFQLLAFLDYGWGTNHTPYPGEPKSDWMLGIGPGFRYTLTPYLTARFDWGFKLHNRPFYTGGRSQGHFSVIGSF